MEAVGHRAPAFQPYVGLSVGLHLGALALASVLGTADAPPLPEVLVVALVAPPAAAAPGPGGATASVAAPPPPAPARRVEESPPAPRPKPKAQPAPRAVSLAPRPPERTPEPEPHPVPPPRPAEPAASSQTLAPAVSSAPTGASAAGDAESSGRSGAGGSASFAPAGSGDAVRAYIALVRSRIQAERRYSPMARRRGLEGTVTVRLQLGASGEVSELDVEDGAPLLLSKATEDAIRRAGPFPPPPEGLGVLRIPVRYRLTD